MHVQSYCFAITFLSFSLPSPPSLLKLPNDELKSDAAICKMIVHIMHFIVLLIVSSSDDDQFCCLLLGKLTWAKAHYYVTIVFLTNDKPSFNV